MWFLPITLPSDRGARSSRGGERSDAMFGFRRKSGARSPSAAMLRALAVDGLPPERVAALALGVVEARGSYAGRTVRYVRVFDQVRAVEGGLNVHAFGDLDRHRNLVLRSGHVEQDGTVILDWRAPSADAATPVRERADRTLRADDERFVFPGTASSKLGGE
jgi:hypothetical protein